MFPNAIVRSCPARIMRRCGGWYIDEARALAQHQKKNEALKNTRYRSHYDCRGTPGILQCSPYRYHLAVVTEYLAVINKQLLTTTARAKASRKASPLRSRETNS